MERNKIQRKNNRDKEVDKEESKQRRKRNLEKVEKERDSQWHKR